jgi:ABC-type lipoprotein export system ATPase subunit
MLVTARGLIKSYGHGRAARRVLDGVDLTVAAGELVALVGPSGSGKSTLLHLIGALDVPDDGDIEVAGRTLGDLDERGLTALRREELGFVFQFFHLIPELTGEENVLLATRLAGNGALATERAHGLIAQLGLGEAAGRRPHELSGGEQQRLAIARALVNEPRLILADEPTGNLDQASGHRVLELLRRLAAGERAVLLVTHDEEAARLADRVLRLEDGRVVD